MTILSKAASDPSLLELQKWIEGQKPRAPDMKDAPLFYRNLEAALDERRTRHGFITLRNQDHTSDFSSNDFLSLATSGMLRKAFLDELNCHPDFYVGSTGSRLSDGNNSYMEALERQIAQFHGAETALMVSSGYDANCAIFSAVPRPGDAIVYDDLIHASVHDGMKSSLSSIQIPYRHNDPDSLRETLLSLKETQPLIRQGVRCVLVAVEAVYSMDGDVAPLAEIVEVVKDIFPDGNAQIIIDEAHSTGLLGKNGRGLVCALGLEEQVAIRLHTYGKGLGTTGAAILSNATVRNMLVNFARPVIYTTAPSFPILATIRAGYNLMESGQTNELQDRVQHLTKLFFRLISYDPIWKEAVNAQICSIPLSEDWESRPFVTQFIPIWTRQGYNFFLAMHLMRDRYSANPIDPPIVPRGTGRVRLVIHASNTEAEIEGLVASICRWAQEMLDIHEGKMLAEVQRMDPSTLAVNPFE
ncbi:PLP-dependent transferase [Thozetella sp. PMI_491]|nr:PLP-dependent transferase [Thozetella sp. PMI_491]